jgi:hypothetical protein
MSGHRPVVDPKIEAETKGQLSGQLLKKAFPLSDRFVFLHLHMVEVLRGSTTNRPNFMSGKNAMERQRHCSSPFFPGFV